MGLLWGPIILAPFTARDIVSAYDFLIDDDDYRVDDDRPHSVFDHRGNSDALLLRHRLDAERALKYGVRGARDMAPCLLDRIADTRTLHAAWDHLARHGGQTPGPDGLRYADLTTDEVWDLCRCLADVIREGRYGRGPERVQWVSKGPGRDDRPLVLSNIADRMVERAMTTILQPVLDPLFDDRSFGYRPGRGPLHALAEAERLTLLHNRRVWLTEDIRDAFAHVPVSRLLQVLAKLLPAPDLIALLTVVLSEGELPGLRQGGPLSPLMLNIYLNHTLDRPWRRDRPGLPLLRFADDLLVPCLDESEARHSYALLERLLVPAGMPLKGKTDESVHVLCPRVAVEWLGFEIARPGCGLAIRIGERSWERLGEQLELAHTKANSPLRAIRVIEGWLGQRGPCYRWSDREETFERIVATARSLAFDEVLGPVALEAIWSDADQRWRQIRALARQTRDVGVTETARTRADCPGSGTTVSSSTAAPWEPARGSGRAGSRSRSTAG